MRINQFLAKATGLSRRSIDRAIDNNKVLVNGKNAQLGQTVSESDEILFDSKPIKYKRQVTTIMVDKPAGFVTSRNGQGSKTIYDALPNKYRNLKPIGRLDKNSSGLILLTDDGNLANRLSHPRYMKQKIYHVTLDSKLTQADLHAIMDGKVTLDNSPSRFKIRHSSDERYLEVTLSEGRNRQIRRTFETLGYKVTSLRRIQFGEYKLVDLNGKVFREVTD
jgi:23S rRNA pseudouridine2605 synthase